MVSLLEVNNLSTSFDIEGEKFLAVNDISFNLKDGEILGIIGESGSGKSVTALSVMNLLPKYKAKIESGSIMFKGKDLTKLKEKELCKIRGEDISIIFQEPMTALNPIVTIEEQIREVLLTHRSLSKNEIFNEIREVLLKLRIPNPEEFMKKYPFEISGGMLQRVVIAMAIICKPSIIIADEPTTALDVTTQAEILNLLKEITKDIGSSIILITHDLGVIAEMATKVAVMYRGRIIEESSSLEFFDNPKHPYSKGLIKSMPKNYNCSNRFYSIKGTVPYLTEEINGCEFCNRCDKSMKICSVKVPFDIKVNEDHRVKCWLYDKR
ncbi:ABC transporter ATP-binding protein [Haloimpatiens sp. FM7315]|uniref:ABC transporter ATP-binding protein n=1 Tax=Haloimpatiens sp. FM7315 TaxID=3298609 RepID=UPI00370B7C9B